MVQVSVHPWTLSLHNNMIISDYGRPFSMIFYSQRPGTFAAPQELQMDYRLLFIRPLNNPSGVKFMMLVS